MRGFESLEPFDGLVDRLRIVEGRLLEVQRDRTELDREQVLLETGAGLLGHQAELDQAVPRGAGGVPVGFGLAAGVDLGAKRGEYNVVLSARQPGSSFKPIVYAAAFEKGYTPDTTLWDVDTVFKTDLKDYIPKNYDFKEHGPVSIRAALQGSLNIAAVKALYLVGVGRVIDFAETLGYSTLGDRSRFGLSLVLGGGEVKLLEHAGAYAAFANDGILQPSSAILRVEDASGNVVQEWKPSEGKRVVSEATARRITDVMADNQARAYVFGTRSALTLGDRPSAAKSGTTNIFGRM
jgi:membrane peptidoglycan carboxypeptidase